MLRALECSVLTELFFCIRLEEKRSAGQACCPLTVNLATENLGDFCYGFWALSENLGDIR